MRFWKKKPEQLTELIEKQKKKHSKEGKTYIEETITPRIDNAMLFIAYLIALPLMVFWMLPTRQLPLDQLQRFSVVLTVGFVTAVIVLVMDRMGLDERNTFKFYPFEHCMDGDITERKTHKVMGWVQLDKKKYETPADFDKEVEKLMKGRNVEIGDSNTLKGIPYVALTDKAENDFILISPGLDIDVAVPLKVGNVTGTWSAGTGDKAAPSYVEPVLEPIRRLSDQRLLPVWFLTGSEGISRRYGRTLNLPAIVSHDELVRLHNKYSMKEGEFFKNISVAAEARAEDMQKTISEMIKGDSKSGQVMAMAFLASMRKGTTTGLPSGRNLMETLFGTRVKKALWAVFAVFLIFINLWVWWIGPTYFPMG